MAVSHLSLCHSLLEEDRIGSDISVLVHCLLDLEGHPVKQSLSAMVTQYELTSLLLQLAPLMIWNCSGIFTYLYEVNML